MKLTSLLQFFNKLQEAGKIDNLQQVCDVFSCVGLPILSFKIHGNQEEVHEFSGGYRILRRE